MYDAWLRGVSCSEICQPANWITQVSTGLVFDMGQCTRCWYLLHQQAANAQPSLRICTDLPNKSLPCLHIRPWKNMCGSGNRTYPKFLPPTLNFFLQILKLEENSRTKFCSTILFQLQNLEKKYISKWPSLNFYAFSLWCWKTRLYLQK